MKSDSTHIAVILDRTGSMESIRDDTIGGFNAFLNQQKAEPGSATLTLVQFDSQDPYEVIHRFKPLKKVPELSRETLEALRSTRISGVLIQLQRDYGPPGGRPKAGGKAPKKKRDY